MLYEALLNAIDDAEQFLAAARELAEVHAFYTMNPHHPEPDKEIQHHANLLRRVHKANNNLIRAGFMLKRDVPSPHPEEGKRPSGYKGVTWHKQARKWMARTRRGVYLGLYPTPEEAYLETLWAEHDEASP